MNEQTERSTRSEIVKSIDEAARRHNEYLSHQATERAVNSIMSVIDRLLAAADAPEMGLDELLDSVHEGACIRNMYSHKGRSSVTVGVPIERPSGGWSGYIEHIATGATRMDAIRNAVAQATGTTQEGTSDA